MRLVFLGTGGYHPNERRHTACVMVPEAGLVFDAGTAIFRVPERVVTQEIDIFLSHAHLDHVIGLTYLLVPLLDGTLRRARVHGTSEHLDAVRRHLFSEPLFPVMPAFDWIPLEPGVGVGGKGVLTYRPLTHPGGSVGFRVDWPGRSIAYITDTIADGSYIEFVRGVDLLIHECNFSDDQADFASQTGHSHTTLAASAARDAGVGRLLFTHINAQRTGDDPIGLEAARAIFAESAVASDLLEVEI
jgi:ribonuclease BN (tRNA processing enzyme)